MHDSVSLLDMAGAAAVEEIEDWLARLFTIGEPEVPRLRPDRGIATEYRLLVMTEQPFIVDERLLGVVNEDFARRKLRQAREEVGPASLERRRVIRGGWERASGVVPRGHRLRDPEESQGTN